MEANSSGSSKRPAVSFRSICPILFDITFVEDLGADHDAQCDNCKDRKVSSLEPGPGYPVHCVTMLSIDQMRPWFSVLELRRGRARLPNHSSGSRETTTGSHIHPLR